MKKTLLGFLIYITFCSAWGLEDDRRMIVRILSVSSSKKTILINRGREEGVKIGDHAKISNPVDGYFARGVVSRVSPTRSVWSLYRILNPKPLVTNTVITIKAASKVKLTRDESKAIGILANSYKKAAKLDPTAEDAPVKSTYKADFLKKKESRNMKYKRGVSYEGLSETFGDGKAKTIDWRGIDGELDGIKDYDDVDFKQLKERVREW
ncbi:MAG: hypothetical protein HN576_05140 [Bacteriovoracaceae bacterium]|jgi:hypothetical protein|nr:hypothetical protein [Bacteriovoracaceae bacterium]